MEQRLTPPSVIWLTNSTRPAPYPERTVNHAFVDGSYDEDTLVAGGAGRGGYGIVLLVPGQPPQYLYGRLDTTDNNATELRAVTEALRHAPPGQPLTVHTDNLSVMSAIRRGSRSAAQHQEAVRVRDEAEVRGIELHLARAVRERRHMKVAHSLANDARLERAVKVPHGPHAEVNLTHAPWRDSAVVTLRRAGECVSAQVPHSSGDPLARSVRALITAVALAHPGETLIVTHASRLAAALWEKPHRALPGAAQDTVRSAVTQAQTRAIQVIFER